jgi:hypothetical protein
LDLINYFSSKSDEKKRIVLDAIGILFVETLMQQPRIPRTRYRVDDDDGEIHPVDTYFESTREPHFHYTYDENRDTYVMSYYEKLFYKRTTEESGEQNNVVFYDVFNNFIRKKNHHIFFRHVNHLNDLVKKRTNRQIKPSLNILIGSVFEQYINMLAPFEVTVAYVANVRRKIRADALKAAKEEEKRQKDEAKALKKKQNEDARKAKKAQKDAGKPAKTKKSKKKEDEEEKEDNEGANVPTSSRRRRIVKPKVYDENEYDLENAI